MMKIDQINILAGTNDVFYSGYTQRDGADIESRSIQGGPEGLPEVCFDFLWPLDLEKVDLGSILIDFEPNQWFT